MTNLTSSPLRAVLMASAATAAVALAMTAPNFAQAAELDSSHVSGGHSGGSGGKGGAGKGKSMKGLFHEVTGAPHSDSDAPDRAGVKGG
jgi:hypothetical protein